MKAKYTTLYQCANCGATSYQPVIDRCHNGQLRPTGQYKCTGCRHVFDSIRQWWEPRRDNNTGTLGGLAAPAVPLAPSVVHAFLQPAHQATHQR
jgi:hypothetical protein